MHPSFRTAALGLAILAALPAAAAPEGYTLWDDFSMQGEIDAGRWLALERVRQRVDGMLRMAQRDRAGQLNNTDMFGNSWSTSLKNPSAITQMRVTIYVDGYYIHDCAANTSTEGPPGVQARALGSFFNVGTPLPGSRVDDIVAGIRLIRRADSADPEGVLRAEGFIGRCTQSDCNFGTASLGLVDLGPVTTATAATVKFDWEPDKDRFNFYLGSGAVQRLSYAGYSDATPPSVPLKVIGTRTILESCMAGRIEGGIDARFDNLSVNSSAAP